MKKILVSVLFSLITISAFAQTDPTTPQNPITMGRGGAYTADAEGYNAFFYNPAGFARKSEFTLLSFNVYGSVDAHLLSLLADAYNKNASSIGSKSVQGQSRDSGTDPSAYLPQAQIDDITTQATTIANYLTSAGSASVTTALQDLAAEPQYASLLAGIDPNNPPTSQSDLLNLLGPTLLSDPSKLTDLVKDLVNKVASVSGVALPAGILNAIASLQSSIQSAIKSLNEQFPGNSSAGALLGIGYVGNGLGIGFFAGVDAGLYHVSDDTLPIARINNTFSMVAGAAFNIWDGFSVGISLRPTILGYSNFNPISLLTSSNGSGFSNLMPLILSDGIYKGFNLGVDIGALLDVKPFTFGLAWKNITPFQISYSHYIGDNAFYQYTGNLFNFKDAGTVADSYQIPWGQLNLGVLFHPDLGAITNLIDFRLEWDLDDVLSFIHKDEKMNTLKDWDAATYALSFFNIGTEIDLLNFIAIRGGFSQGAFTAGFGLKLLIMDINAAFSAKYGNGPLDLGHPEQVGFSIEVALLRI